MDKNFEFTLDSGDAFLPGTCIIGGQMNKFPLESKCMLKLAYNNRISDEEEDAPHQIMTT
jgi:hypothetical protein